MVQKIGNWNLATGKWLQKVQHRHKVF